MKEPAEWLRGPRSGDKGRYDRREVTWAMIVELHLLQNFAPANLNRDDTGSPKDCVFGGYRRARLSSQAQKRAIRERFSVDATLPAGVIGKRTKRLSDAIAAGLTTAGRPELESQYVANRMIEALGIKPDSKRPDETSYLVFIGVDEIERLTRVAEEHWESLVVGVDPADKKAKKPELPKEVVAPARSAIDGRRAVDIALFGRMVADLPDRNRDAAAQVAHAISVNRVEVEFDFFTAVDDLKNPHLRDDDAGAGMLGTIEFNSACFYRYFNVDLDQLSVNLGGDRELVEAALRAYLNSAIEALPTGKQNSFAAHQPASLVLAIVRERGLQSLANAFVKPVTPWRDNDLIASSVHALDRYLGRLDAMYGDTGITNRIAAVDDEYSRQIEFLKEARVERVADVVERAVAAALPA